MEEEKKSRGGGIDLEDDLDNLLQPEVSQKPKQSAKAPQVNKLELVKKNELDDLDDMLEDWGQGPKTKAPNT